MCVGYVCNAMSPLSFTIDSNPRMWIRFWYSNFECAMLGKATVIPYQSSSYFCVIEISSFSSFFVRLKIFTLVAKKRERERRENVNRELDIDYVLDLWVLFFSMFQPNPPPASIAPKEGWQWYDENFYHTINGFPLWRVSRWRARSEITTFDSKQASVR